MYYGELGDLDMYVFNSTGYIERRSVLLPTGIFNSPGTLSLGHWLPPSSGEQMTSPTALQGQIDNFLIWKIPIEPNAAASSLVLVKKTSITPGDVTFL
jgi:hypothetical protein